MKRRNLGWLMLGSLFSSAAWADMQLNMTKGVTDISQEVFGLHMLVMWICTAIGIVVFGAMFWSMIFHRKSKGVKPATFHESTKVEILWTAIPIIILIGMAWPATKTLIAMENNDNSDITIQVTGSQWKWHYKYFDSDIEFYSVLTTPKDQYDNRDGNYVTKGENYLLEVDKHLVIPVNKKVRFLITSDDVIHSWWVPDFAVKQDANPGFINEAWTKVNEPGIYRGQCAELCGKDHGYMPVVVEVKSEADYAMWIEEQKLAIEEAKLAEQESLASTMSMEELMSLGEETYVAYCAACHQTNGMGLPPAFPALKGSPMVTEDKAAHIDIVLNGKAGTSMAGFGKQLNLKQLAAVVTYERNAWGNNTGEMVQPADVNAMAAPAQSAEVKAEDSKESAEKSVETVALVSEKSEASEDTASISEPATMEQLMAEGEKVYIAKCAACHQANGAGLPPAFPALKGSPMVTQDIPAHIEMVKNGKPGTAMMGFKDQLNAREMAAVITYERNAWGNDTGELVQASDIDAKQE